MWNRSGIVVGEGSWWGWGFSQDWWLGFWSCWSLSLTAVFWIDFSVACFKILSRISLYSLHLPRTWHKKKKKKHLKSRKIQKLNCRWKFGSNFTFLNQKLGKIKKMHSQWKFFSNFAFLHLPDLQTLEIRENPEIPQPMKIWLKFHIFAPPPQIGQNPENELAMKIRLEFRILAPPLAVNTWNPAKSRNSTADENLAQISHFCPQNRAKSRKCTRDENSARISHSCTSRTCKHLKSGKIQKFHCRWFETFFWLKFHIFAPCKMKSGDENLAQKVQKMPMKIWQIFFQKNGLAMKILLEFHFLAPSGPVNTWN